ncbi:Hypothetical predicted protein [Marmota monax]|uniref:Uncharacterized protein n=1 Tax=Marmota monax TaxID=9995 RepID=A0A5E4A0X5_MARMO|nr:Hypothetical predicted protein [Marmota monax]
MGRAEQMFLAPGAGRGRRPRDSVLPPSSHLPEPSVLPGRAPCTHTSVAPSGEPRAGPRAQEGRGEGLSPGPQTAGADSQPPLDGIRQPAQGIPQLAEDGAGDSDPCGPRAAHPRGVRAGHRHPAGRLQPWPRLQASEEISPGHSWRDTPGSREGPGSAAAPWPVRVWGMGCGVCRCAGVGSQDLTTDEIAHTVVVVVVALGFLHPVGTCGLGLGPREHLCVTHCLAQE